MRRFLFNFFDEDFYVGANQGAPFLRTYREPSLQAQLDPTTKTCLVDNEPATLDVEEVMQQEDYP